MAQILDLSKRYSKEQIESITQSTESFDLPAGGYVCKIVNVVLNDDQASGRANIELHVDITEGAYSGYFQQLEDHFGFWGLKGWLSFKETELSKFQRACAALCISNPGLEFNPFKDGGVDVDILKGKMIGVVTRKEEYRSSSGDLRDKNAVYYFTEVAKIREHKYKVPPKKFLIEKPTGFEEPYDPSFPPSDKEEIPL